MGKVREEENIESFDISALLNASLRSGQVSKSGKSRILKTEYDYEYEYEFLSTPELMNSRTLSILPAVVGKIDADQGTADFILYE